MSSILPKLLRAYSDHDNAARKPCGQASRLTLMNLRSKLGEGPIRFAPQAKERSIRDQLDALSASERACLEHMKSKWESKHAAAGAAGEQYALFTDEMYLRFARCSSFSDRSALKTMKKYPRNYQYLTAAVLEQRLRSKTVFPVPKLSTLDGGYEVCYMRPSRCAAKKACGESKQVIHSLAYTLSTMMEREAPCTHGVAFLANMDDFAMSNFATDYWFQFMSILQGQLVPVRVNVLLIVNPPEWFGTIWNIMKTMLTADFQERVRMISEFELPQYLAAGYEEFLPNDMTSGEALTDELVADFVDYRKAIEAAQGHNNNNTSLSRQQSMRRGSSSSSSRDLLGGSLNQTSLRRSMSLEDSDGSLRGQMTKNNRSPSRSTMASPFEKPPRDLGSSLNQASLRRSLSLEDSDGSLCRPQMTNNNNNNNMLPSCRSMVSSPEKPPMMSKQRSSGMMSKQPSIRALASDAMMNMSMPSRNMLSRQNSSTQTLSRIKRQSSEKTANSSQSSKTTSNMGAGDDPQDLDNSDESLNVFDLEKSGSDLLVVEACISDHTGKVVTPLASSSSTSRLPSTACW